MDISGLSRALLGRDDAAIVICPTGCFAIWLSSPLCKNISLHRRVEAVLLIAPSTPQRGRIAIVTDAGLDAMDAAATQDERR
jgi:hypothetical protein